MINSFINSHISKNIGNSKSNHISKSIDLDANFNKKINSELYINSIPLTKSTKVKQASHFSKDKRHSRNDNRNIIYSDNTEKQKTSSKNNLNFIREGLIIKDKLNLSSKKMINKNSNTNTINNLSNNKRLKSKNISENSVTVISNLNFQQYSENSNSENDFSDNETKEINIQKESQLKLFSIKKNKSNFNSVDSRISSICNNIPCSENLKLVELNTEKEEAAEEITFSSKEKLDLLSCNLIKKQQEEFKEKPITTDKVNLKDETEEDFNDEDLDTEEVKYKLINFQVFK